MRLPELLDIHVLERLAEANHRANGMPIGLIDATDGSVLVGAGWQEICVSYHRVHPETAERCRESDESIKRNLSPGSPCEYRCRNGLRDIGIPIMVGGAHLATLFMGQFFYEEEAPDRGFFRDQAHRFGFDERAYLAALDRVPVFSRKAIENILSYNGALARFISDVAEASLRQREANAALRRHELVVRHTRDVILFVRREDGRILDANPAATAAYGHDRETLLRLTIRDLRAPETHATLDAQLAEAGDRGILFESLHRRSDGTTFPVEVSARGILVEGTEVLVSVVRDISERKRAEEARRIAAEELNALNARLLEADRRKDEFLGMLSHELRNPLAPIRTAIHLLRHAAPGGEQARRAQAVIERQAEHLTRLVDDLLDVTRIARGRLQLRRERIELRELVRRAAEDFRLGFEERGVSFLCELPRTAVDADGDPTRITQVVGNLLHNAAKFTSPGDEVTLALAVCTGAAEIRVRDTGAGIDPELLPSVFEPFVQGERTLARTDGGLGLGLSVAKAIAEQHGGSVRAESAGYGRGAEFTVRLPVLAAAPVAARAVATPDRLARGRRVLVVDDNTDAAESLADLLRLLGHEVEVAFDGPSAVERARSCRPDVVLCDIGLPGMSGYDVARAIRAARLDGIRLVAVSGYAQPEDVRCAMDAGFDEHVAKPPAPEVIERLLE